MYYHILVETNKETVNKEIVQLNILDKKVVINDVLEPYLSNVEFYLNGYVLKKQYIQKLIVFTSREPVNDDAPSRLMRMRNRNNIE